MTSFRFAVIALALSLAAPVAFAAGDVAALKADADAAVQAAVAAPGDYAANWKAAKALRLWGDAAVTQKVQGWKDIAKSAGKDGMKFGDMATKLNASGIEGWYYYGLSVGTYSDGVSIITALTEGLKGKTQKSFETAYATDKTFDTGGPILALGRFWQVLPGIAGRDMKKAERFLNEYIALVGDSKDADKDAWYFRGQLYKDTGRKDEARADLQKAASMGSGDAAKLLADLK
jgi:tetratricopeptide (TPR) repeat protein